MGTGIYRPQRNYGCRIHDQVTTFGMRTVVLENDKVRVSILPDKGTEIFEYLYKSADLDFMWLSAQGVQNPGAYLPTSPDSVSSFIDYYPGGWQEVFPNGGPPSLYMGAQFGQHGEVAHMPWDYEIVEDTPERIGVRFRVRPKKVPFELRKTIRLELGSPALFIEEELENLAGLPLQFMWGHHIALGQPFVEPGCRIRLPEGAAIVTEEMDSQVPPGRVKRGKRYEWPLAEDLNGQRFDLSVLPDRGEPSDIVYLTGFEDKAWYEVENQRLGLGLRVEWDGKQFPHAWYWQEFGDTKAYPWYGRHYNIGLEPFCGYPTSGIEESLRNGSAGTIGPMQTLRFWLRTVPYEAKK
ncbi:DUF4432 family protein [Paenibacillus montanisoli]|uniref:DUF4432 domain-containing protein n=1 Tax=Paenibacillus montanisoli TaxID=2081970 RepID=A0A328TU49_9BACL|nr:DUF4432 family protein [Paenibacillus montanisoli]RAP74068.1 DUF4432 domain-containing protein [Paenibacillus montanisoli]